MAVKKRKKPTNLNTQHKRDIAGKEPAKTGYEHGHVGKGIKSTRKTKQQSKKSNRAEGGKKGSKAGKAKGGAKSSRKGVKNGSRKPRNYTQEKRRQRATGYAPKRAKR